MAKIFFFNTNLKFFPETYSEAEKNKILKKKVIIIGASSGTGAALAKCLDKKGYSVGLTARRENLLKEIQNNLENPSYIKAFDVCDSLAKKKFKGLIKEMGGVDLVVICAGGILWPKTKKELYTINDIATINLNLIAFIKIANTALKHFEAQKKGHLVGISSVGSVRGSKIIAAYGAAKAGLNFYMEAMAQKMRIEKLNINITNIILGMVKSEVKGFEKIIVGNFDQVAEDIYEAIKAKTVKIIIPHKWNYLTKIIQLLPNCIYDRIIQEISKVSPKVLRKSYTLNGVAFDSFIYY